MFLATTADQSFWKKDEKILFLGEWCKLFNQKSVWSQLNYEVLPYHWQSREEYFQDYLYLDQLYERWLPALAKNLNALHDENHSNRYWRIILGPWLYYFIQTCYDRYLSVCKAIASRKVTLTWVPRLKENDFTPKDFSTFGNWQSQDSYNLYLYSWLIEAMGGVPFEIQNRSIQQKKVPLLANTGSEGKIKLGLKQIMKIYSELLPKNHDIALISLYARKRDIIRLQLSLGQLPSLHTPQIVPSDAALNFQLRNKLKVPVGEDEFTSLFSRLLPSQIPKAYLENYSELKEKAKRAFPKSPKVIVAVNTHYGNEGFKIWCADRVEKGTRLVGMPHGAHYGNALYSANETHEKKVANHYFSWGWEDKKNPHVIPLSSIQLVGTQKQIRFDSHGGILWLGMSRPRYFNWMISAPRGCEMLEYIEDQKLFLKTLDPDTKDILLMRLFPSDYDLGVREHLMKVLSGYRFSNRKETLLQELCKSRLCVASYNASPILETLSADFPTVAFWNFNHWELRDSAIPYFEKMVHVGIFHKNPASAARKVNEIYQDPMSWWLSPEIQDAKNRFCDQFAHTSPTWLSEWKKELYRIAWSTI